jgi:hypothetical protein
LFVFLSLFLYICTLFYENQIMHLICSSSCFYQSLSFCLFFFRNQTFEFFLSSFFLFVVFFLCLFVCPFPFPNLFWKPIFCHNFFVFHPSNFKKEITNQDIIKSEVIFRPSINKLFFPLTKKC